MKLLLITVLVVAGVYLYGYHFGQDIATLAKIDTVQVIDTRDGLSVSDGTQLFPDYQVQPAINVMR